MMVRSSTNRIVVWGILGLIVLLAMGCAHRSSHGSSQHGKKFEKGRSVAHQMDLSDLTPLKDGKESVTGGQGYFSDAPNTFSDLLEEEPLIGEDPPFGQKLQADASPSDYWMNRTRAEQLTAQSGLQDVHFSLDSFQLNEQSKMILRSNAEWMNAHSDAEVTIEGHCDTRGTSSYNYVLGEKRALRTKNYLTSLGVPHEQLHVMSYGKEKPACWDPTEPCYQKNRRAHLVLEVKMTSTAMR